MEKIKIVMLKEIIDNLRDRRSFFFALVYGPVLMPVLIFVPMILGLKSTMIDYDVTSNLYVDGAEYAPNLIQYLRNNNLEALDAPVDYRQRIKERELEVVLVITPEYGKNLRQGKRAPLTLYVNRSSKKSQSSAEQVRNLIKAYSHQLGYWRMTARGIQPDIQKAIYLLESDVSSEGVSGMIFGFFVYFIIVFSMMTGGFYLAIDSTAGERERHSLEPLLSLPISRSELVLGKWLAVLVFVLLSCLLTTAFIYLTLTLIPLGNIADVFSIEGATLVYAFLVVIPCAFLVSSLLISVAAFTRSTKEAQTYISIMYLIPMIPSILTQFVDLKPSLSLYVLPFFSQNQLINKIVKSENITLEQIAASCSGTLLLAGLMLYLALWLYRQDKILSN